VQKFYLAREFIEPKARSKRALCYFPLQPNTFENKSTYVYAVEFVLRTYLSRQRLLQVVLQNITQTAYKVEDIQLCGRSNSHRYM